MYETNWEVYRISKLKKYMEMVKFCMQVGCYTIVTFIYLLMPIQQMMKAFRNDVFLFGKLFVASAVTYEWSVFST